jgi:nitrite reductase/ring-hydroxylating ferredoxin subunit/uncharacterized membrane protein
VITEAFVTFVGRETSLDRLSDALQPAIGQLFRRGGTRGQKLKDVLNGTWLGHPLHPALTDVPIGCWTAALVLDVVGVLTGRDELAPGADLAVAIGLAGALGAAVAGITDWSDTDSRPRRVGIAHALINSSATLLYAASLAIRRKARGPGIALSLAGYGVMTMGAYLGGHLLTVERVGVDHAAQKLPDEFVPVLADADLRQDELRSVDANGVPIVLVRRGGAIYALGEVCAHLGGPLSQGTLEDGTVRCPWHGSRFALDDGHIVNGPSAFAQPCFETRVRDGRIEVRGVSG